MSRLTSNVPCYSIVKRFFLNLLCNSDSLVHCPQVLRRKERECEHEMERLAREKIAAQQRLAALKREVSVRAAAHPRSIGTKPPIPPCAPGTFGRDYLIFGTPLIIQRFYLFIIIILN